jgi:hypothetical protein
MKLRNVALLAIIVASTSYASYGVMRSWSRQQGGAGGRGYRAAAAAGALGGARGAHGFIAYPRPVHRFRDLRELFDQSTEVVVGVPVSKSSRLSGDAGSMVLTDYEVQVLETFKGDRHKGRSITLEVPGGSVAAADGSINEVRMPDFWKNPEVGKGYVFFLKKRKDSPSLLVGGPQGSFEITPWAGATSQANRADVYAGRVVIPQVRESDELTKAYSGKGAADFIGEIRGMAPPVARAAH